MSTAPAESQISDYLGRVRAALADLPADARDELLEDLPDHLTEVLAEDAGTLTERLGEPEAYAAELRAAAGMAAAAAPDGVARRRLRAATERLDASVGPALGYRRASELLAQLRPGWWVLRGYFAGLLAYAMIFGSPPLLPPANLAALVWLILVLGAVAGSIRLGRVNLRPTGRAVLAVATVFLLVFAVAALNFNRQQFEPAASTVDRYDGVIDVYPYDANGRPLQGVHLYDQNGVPIVLGNPFRCLQPRDKPQVLPGLDKIDLDWGRGYPLCPPIGWSPSGTTVPQPGPSPAPQPQPSRTG